MNAKESMDNLKLMLEESRKKYHKTAVKIKHFKYKIVEINQTL